MVVEDNLSEDGESVQLDEEDDENVDEESGMYTPTLTRVEEDDVALDMDTLDLHSASDDEYDSDVSEGM